MEKLINVTMNATTIDEFESVGRIPVRLSLKECFPNSPRIILARTFWFFLALMVVMTGDMMLMNSASDTDFMKQMNEGVGILFHYLFLIIVVLTCVKLIYEIFFFLMYNYTIELEHLVITRGVFLRSRASFPIAKINDASIRRNLIELMFGIHSLDILTASPSSEFGMIEGLSRKNAVDLQAYLMMLIETTLPDVGKKAIRIIEEGGLTRQDTKLLSEGKLSTKPEKVIPTNTNP